MWWCPLGSAGGWLIWAALGLLAKRRRATAIGEVILGCGKRQVDGPAAPRKPPRAGPLSRGHQLAPRLPPGW